MDPSYEEDDSLDAPDQSSKDDVSTTVILLSCLFILSFLWLVLITTYFYRLYRKDLNAAQPDPTMAGAEDGSTTASSWKVLVPPQSPAP